MTARITVYCTHSLAHLTGSYLSQWLDQADLLTLAGWFGIEDEEVVRTARSYLRLESSHPTGFNSWTLHYRPEGMRPITIERIATQAGVQELVQEALEALPEAPEWGVEHVRSHLLRVQEAVDTVYGFPSPNDMGEVLAYELSRVLAQPGQGYVKDNEQAWWTFDRWTWKRLYPEA